MQNWFDIITPHEDIRNGDFNEAVFAADLGDVVRGAAPSEYQDPYAFFKRTYFTDGLTKLIKQVHKKLSEGKGPSVVELKTPFGGGKTHSLVSVYHYVKHSGQVLELLPDGLKPMEVPVCAIVGNQLNTREGIASDGITRYTLWGELAFQLGGSAAYNKLAGNDQERIAPGKNDLRSLLDPFQPFVILLDEVLEYVNAAHGVEVGETTLATQTFTFLKQLTEAVAGLDRGLMIVTLPSSELEDFGEDKQQDLARLDKIFGRLVDIQTPVRGEEVYSIIRRRLFEPVKESENATIRAIIDEYIQQYQNCKDELPAKVRNPEYRKTMELSYPFHPDVIDILHEKWGTFSSFQRTRGVLRLLASVVEDLYTREVNLDVILPGDISLDDQAIMEEFLKHIGAEHDSVITSDIANSGKAKAQLLDAGNKDWKHLAERISTGIFLHSFTADEPERGTNPEYIKLAVLRSGSDMIPPLVDSVLQKLTNQLWYLNTKGGQYYFSKIPNLIRMVADKKERIPDSDARSTLERQVRKNLGNKMRWYLWDISSHDIPDNTDLKLVLLDPEQPFSEKELHAWLEKKGENFRVFKNTVFFAIPDDERYSRLKDLVQEYLALQDIREDIRQGHYPGLQGKSGELDRRIRDIGDDFGSKIRELYRTLGVPAAGNTIQKIDLGKPTFGSENLDTWIYSELTDDSHKKILTNPPSGRFLASKFLSNNDAVSLDTLREQFYKNPELPLPENSDILVQGIVRGVQEGAFGYGFGTPENIKPETVRFQETVSPFEIQFHDDEYLLSPQRAQSLKAEVGESAYPQEAGSEGRSNTSEPSVVDTESTGTTDLPKEERVNEVSLRISGLKATKFADVYRGVIMPLVNQAGDFDFTIEFRVESDDGISKRVLEQQVYETLRQLGAVIKEP